MPSVKSGQNIEAEILRDLIRADEEIYYKHLPITTDLAKSAVQKLLAQNEAYA